MTLVVPLAPEPGDAVDLEGDALRAWLAERYALDGDRWLRLELVTGLGGQITGPSGTSDDLTGGIDRVLLGVLRRSADAVLVGAGSARAERLRLPATAALAIASRRGRLAPEDVPAPEDGRRALVLCPAAVSGRQAELLGDRADVVPVPGGPDAARPLLDALADRGLGRVVCEGGGGLATVLLAAGAVDEFDQTIAPIASSPGAPLLSGPLAPVGARLAGLLRDETDRLYARWRFPAG
ncbi:dihydrofolate reductase family protein [Amnibacterium endophyticum]|uniref:Dihydrofolate reductase family protein n=1 Tax=Amnibacterium endophyticum TaxID=2109337 RepID=A0ABW4LI86_9MICO